MGAYNSYVFQGGTTDPKTSVYPVVNPTKSFNLQSIDTTTITSDSTTIVNNTYTFNNNIYANASYPVKIIRSGSSVFGIRNWNDITVNSILLGGGGSYFNSVNYKGGHGLHIYGGILLLTISKGAALLGGGGCGGGGNDASTGGPGGGGGGGKGDSNNNYGMGGNILSDNTGAANFFSNSTNGPGGGGPGGGIGANIMAGRSTGGNGGSYDTTTGLYIGGNALSGTGSGGGGGYGGGNGVGKGSVGNFGGGGGGGGGIGIDGGKNGGYGIRNEGDIYHLRNYQGGNNIYGPLFYSGSLPSVYTIYVDTTNNYGQIYLTGADNNSTFPTFPGGDVVIYVSLSDYFKNSNLFGYNKFLAVIVGNFTNAPPDPDDIDNYKFKITKQSSNANISGINYGVYDLEIYSKLSEPLNLTYTPGDKRIDFSFTRSSNDNNDHGNYFYSTDGITFYSITGTSGTITTTSNNTSYDLVIRSSNHFGYGTISSSTKVYTYSNPGKPTITSISVGNTNITIHYTLGTSGAVSISKNFLSYRDSTETSFSDETDLGTNGPNNFSNLTGGSAYFFRLRSENNVGLKSDYSDIFPSSNDGLKVYIPSEPRDITLSDGNNSSVLTFNPVLNDGGYSVSSYKFKKDNEDFVDIYPTPLGSSNYTTTINSLTNGSTYVVTVKATNAAGSSEASNAITLTNNPGAPTITTTTAGNGSVNINYTTNKNGGKDIIANFLYYKTSSTSYQTYGINIGTSESHTVTGLTPDILYTFKLISRNEKIADSASSTEVSVTPILNPQNISIIPTKNYFFYNSNCLDTIYALNTSFNGTITTLYKMNEIDIGRRYLSGTSTSTNYKKNNADINTLFSSTNITYTNGVRLPVDRLSITTKNAILSSSTTVTTTSTDPEISISAGVYGCKLLFSSYTGPVMTLRRGNDSKIAHFYAKPDGTLGTEYLGEGISLSIWLPTSTTAYVEIWWDQTGNGNHAYQSINANQPNYNSVNKYIEFPSFTYFNLRNGVHPWNNSHYTYVFKCSITAVNGAIFGGGGDVTNNQNNKVNAFRRDNFGYKNYWYNVDIDSSNTYEDNSVISLVYNGSNRYIYKNSNIIASASASNRNQTNINNTIGRSPFGTEYMEGGYIQYMYIIPLAISSEDRTILENT